MGGSTSGGQKVLDLPDVQGARAWILTTTTFLHIDPLFELGRAILFVPFGSVKSAKGSATSVVRTGQYASRLGAGPAQFNNVMPV